MEWEDVNVLITGGAGFIGTALYSELSNKNAEVLIYDITEGKDILNKYQLFSTIENFRPDIIYHLAAISQVPVSNTHPSTTLETNIQGTVNLLEAARRCNVRKVIVASSDKSYGDKNALEYTEGMTSDALFPYDVSKMVTEKIATTYSFTYNMDIVVSKFANIYGGNDYNWGRLIPGVIRDCVRGRQPVMRSSGKMSREWLYIDDCVNGYLKLADAKRGVYNFGGEWKTVIDVVKMIGSYFGNPEPIILDQAKYEISDQVINWDKAKTELNWHPTTSLTIGIEKTIESYRRCLDWNK